MWLRGLLLLMVLAWAGCATPGRPVISERGSDPQRVSVPARPTTETPRADVYVVKRGDTLYSIAWRFGLDMKALARGNGLRPPYTIYPDQRLRLNAQRAVASTPSPTTRSSPRTRSTPSRQKPVPATPPPRAPVGKLVWRWPASSPVVREFGGTSKGLDFEMKPGAPVSAAAAGDVVYAGSGLGGYERLVIVKHDDSYLSAYSLNQPFTVREGQRVNGGQRIANVTQGSAKARTLHFEIRRDGNPVSPRSLLRHP